MASISLRLASALFLACTLRSNLAYIGAGVALIILGAIIAVPLIKIAVIAVGVLVVAVSLYNVFRTFTGKPGQTPLPDAMIKK